MFHTTAVNLALPAIRSDLGGGVTGLQWCVGAYSLAFASFLLPCGALADRLGARRVFTIGLALLTLAAALAVAAPSVVLLVLSQALAGIGASMVAPSSLSIVRGAFPVPAERARAVALVSLGMAAGFGMGPVLGGALTEWVGWRAVFVFELPCCVALIAMARGEWRTVLQRETAAEFWATSSGDSRSIATHRVARLQPKSMTNSAHSSEVGDQISLAEAQRRERREFARKLSEAIEHYTPSLSSAGVTTNKSASISNAASAKARPPAGGGALARRADEEQ